MSYDLSMSQTLVGRDWMLFLFNLYVILPHKQIIKIYIFRKWVEIMVIGIASSYAANDERLNM